jgi:2'-5' RNA ligase
VRTFFALDINATDKTKIAFYRAQYLSLPFQLIDKKNFHITLSFLGATTPEQQQALMLFAADISAQLQDISPDILLLDHCGLFKKPKVFYLGLYQQPTWLQTLAQALIDYAKNLNIPQENRPYCPHLSIYRKAILSAPATKKLAPPLPITISSFSLYQSISTLSGVVYQPINTWSLTTNK